MCVLSFHCVGVCIGGLVVVFCARKIEHLMACRIAPVHCVSSFHADILWASLPVSLHV